MPALDVCKFVPARVKSTDKFSREPSKALEAEWLAATSQTKTALLSIDCKAEADLCQEQSVISYPAIRVFDGSEKVRRYKGPRKASA
jgi:protein disulfide-isomerase A1